MFATAVISTVVTFIPLFFPADGRINQLPWKIAIKDTRMLSQRRQSAIAVDAVNDDNDINDDNDSRIVGGTTISPSSRYSYLTAIFQFADSSQQSAKLICGGVLVSSSAVVTSAHCGSKVDYVNVGAYDTTDPDPKSVEAFYVKNKIVHPDYDASSSPKAYDVMILILDGEAVKSSPIGKINRRRGVPLIGQDLTVMGWGATRYGGPDVSQPRETNVQYWSDITCIDEYQNVPDFVFQDCMLCAYTEGHDACTFDSGGPLIIKGSDSDSDVLVGIVNSGIGCDTGYPGVYTRISEVRRWIREVIKDNESTDIKKKESDVNHKDQPKDKNQQTDYYYEYDHGVDDYYEYDNGVDDYYDNGDGGDSGDGADHAADGRNDNGDVKDQPKDKGH